MTYFGEFIFIVEFLQGQFFKWYQKYESTSLLMIFMRLL